MPDMIATKRLKYGTRRLLPGDKFEARHDRDARLLIGIGKARYATRDMVAEEPSVGLQLAGERGPELVNLPSGSHVEPVDDRPALRAAYEAKFGKKPFAGWSSDTLREKLAAE